MKSIIYLFIFSIFFACSNKPDKQVKVSKMTDTIQQQSIHKDSLLFKDNKFLFHTSHIDNLLKDERCNLPFFFYNYFYLATSEELKKLASADTVYNEITKQLTLQPTYNEYDTVKNCPSWAGVGVFISAKAYMDIKPLFFEKIKHRLSQVKDYQQDKRLLEWYNAIPNSNLTEKQQEKIILTYYRALVVVYEKDDYELDPINSLCHSLDDLLLFFPQYVHVMQKDKRYGKSFNKLLQGINHAYSFHELEGDISSWAYRRVYLQLISNFALLYQQTKEPVYNELIEVCKGKIRHMEGK